MIFTTLKWIFSKICIGRKNYFLNIVSGCIYSCPLFSFTTTKNMSDMKMLTKISGALLASFLLLSCNQKNKEIQEASNEVLVLENFRLIDGNGGNPIENTKILVKNGKIAEIGNDISDKDAQIVDLKGKTIIPL